MIFCVLCVYIVIVHTIVCVMINVYELQVSDLIQPIVGMYVKNIYFYYCEGTNIPCVPSIEWNKELYKVLHVVCFCAANNLPMMRAHAHWR